MGICSSDMGSGSISVPELLVALDREKSEKGTTLAVSDGPVPEEDQLPSELLALGVEMGEASVPDAIRCWKLVAEPDFWRNHYHLHPCNKRVKNWLFVHRSFRESTYSIVQDAEAVQKAITEGCAASKTQAATKAVQKSFKSLAGKVARHSEFEDTQLFRFFKENVPEAGDQMRDLEADHSDKQLETDALDRLEALLCAPMTAAGRSSGDDLASAEAVTAAVKAYAASLMLHLDREEKAIVVRWLALDAGMYAKYRTYLTGMYRMIY